MVKRLQKISKYKPSIFQGRMDFSPVSGMSFTAEHPMERLMLRAACLMLVVLLFGYLYFVTASVLNVMARKEAMAKITNIQGSIGSLEQQYFALSQGLTPQEGETLGLSHVSQTQYVYRPGNVGAVTIARNEI
jgi:hypothetical protein